MYVLFKYETYCFNLTTGLKFIPRLPGSRNQECKFYKGSHNSERVLKGDTLLDCQLDLFIRNVQT